MLPVPPCVWAVKKCDLDKVLIEEECHVSCLPVKGGEGELLHKRDSVISLVQQENPP